MKKLLALLMCVLLYVPTAKAMGVYEDNGCFGAKETATYSAWVGAKPTNVLDFLTYGTWSQVEGDAGFLIPCWSGQGYQLILSLPMLTTDKSATLADVANGLHDATYIKIANLLVSNGLQNTILRVGWEFNLSNSIWFAGTTQAQFAQWIAAFRHIVQVMRAVPGQQFKFDWNFSYGSSSMDAADAYPGNDVVDIIGIDVYDMTWEGTTPQARWNDYLNAPLGLQWLVARAKLLGKPFSIPEWGVGTSYDGHGAGDDPYFVQHMSAWIKANSPAYVNYWDNDNWEWKGKVSGGNLPLSGAALKSAFGQ